MVTKRTASKQAKIEYINRQKLQDAAVLAIAGLIMLLGMCIDSLVEIFFF